MVQLVNHLQYMLVSNSYAGHRLKSVLINRVFVNREAKNIFLRIRPTITKKYCLNNTYM